MEKKIPLRQCIICKGKFPKAELIRLVAQEPGNVEIDRSGRAQCRGAYVCRSPECIEKAAKSKSFTKNFNRTAGEELIAEMLELTGSTENH